MNKILQESDIKFTQQTYHGLNLAIIGQVDHGKSHLFETLSGKKVIKYESGGITQTVYSFVSGNKVFFDTPGHENFAHMKENVLNICDLNLLVISPMSARADYVQNIIKDLLKTNKKLIILLSF